MQDRKQAIVRYFTSPFLIKNIIENPLCNCGEIDDPFHFLFECNQYNPIRRGMLTCVFVMCNPNLNILLHGNEDLSEEPNINIFMAVHNLLQNLSVSL